MPSASTGKICIYFRPEGVGQDVFTASAQTSGPLFKSIRSASEGGRGPNWCSKTIGGDSPWSLARIGWSIAVASSILSQIHLCLTKSATRAMESNRTALRKGLKLSSISSTSMRVIVSRCLGVKTKRRSIAQLLYRAPPIERGHRILLRAANRSTCTAAPLPQPSAT